MSVKISIVVPTYKRNDLLARCIKALAAQQFNKDEYEIIIVTDGPVDDTVLLMETGASRYSGYNIHICSTPYKKGPASARNAGWQQAQADLVLFTDDDCIPSPQWLSEYWDVYNRQPGDAVALNGPVHVPLQSTPTDFEKNTARLEEAEFITANCACSKKALQQINGFDEAFSMAWREDSDLHFKLLEAGIPIIQVPGALVVHPVRSAAFGVSLKEQRKSMYNALLYKKYPRLYKNKIGATPLWNYYLMILLMLVSITCLAFNKPVAALIFLLIWGFLLIQFTAKRLNGTVLSVKHVTEMIVTSACIPFLSVYWTLYGSLKFKKLLL